MIYIVLILLAGTAPRIWDGVSNSNNPGSDVAVSRVVWVGALIASVIHLLLLLN